MSDLKVKLVPLLDTTMTFEWLRAFRESVQKHFQPLAKSAGLPFGEIASGVFEISGPVCSLRVRNGTGHQRDFSIILRANSALLEARPELIDEFGMSWVAIYLGSEMPEQRALDVWTVDKAVQKFSAASEALCFPFLTGTLHDFERLREFVTRKIDESASREERYVLPPYAMKKWDNKGEKE